MAGEHYEIRDMNKTSLSKGLDLKNKKWNFSIKREDYLDIKKLSSINGTKLLNISVVNGLVKINETSAWELEIDKIEDRNANFILNKKFLNCINDKEEITFYIFETFMLIKDDESNLMLSFEQDWSEDDV